jgi:hypothetical protein
MTTIRFVAFSLSLLAAACGGADFQTGAPAPGDGAALDGELDGSGTGGSPSDGATPGTGGAAAGRSTGGAGGAENASGGARATGGLPGSGGALATGGAGGLPGSGGALATGGAGPGGTGAAGGSAGTGGAPATGGATGTGGATVNGDCPPFACPVCKEDLGNCCLGPRFAYTGCGCLFATGVPSTPFACHQE